MKTVIGIDPDSKAHGVALYCDGKLKVLGSLTLMGIVDKIRTLPEYQAAEYHIENVCANNASFQGVRSAKVQKDIGRRIGMVQQAQTELVRALDHLGVKYKLHKISSAWKDQQGKKQFELVTGWSGRSNEDTRSAAYFGFLGCK